MIIYPLAGKNERMGKVFKTKKHLLTFDGFPAIHLSIKYMQDEFNRNALVVASPENSDIDHQPMIVCNDSKSQVDTVLFAIHSLGWKGSFFVVDCDVMPEHIPDPRGNTVYLFENESRRNQYSNFFLSNDYEVESCNEKEYLSRWAGTGIYFFDSAAQFTKHANYCKSISEVITKMLKSGIKFHGETNCKVRRFGTIYDITGL